MNVFFRYEMVIRLLDLDLDKTILKEHSSHTTNNERQIIGISSRDRKSNAWIQIQPTKLSLPFNEISLNM